MKLDILISGQARTVELDRNADGWRVTLDGRSVHADAIEVAPNIFSILIDGQSHEIRVTRLPDGTLALQTGHDEFSAEVVDPRVRRGRRHSALELEGRQQVVAPMPGKIIRVLVQAGDKVEAGQGLLVVEAMKMQNEIRSPKSGNVERLLVKEGQSVNAGEVLASIE